MAGEKVSGVADAAQDDADARQNSTIGFPYNPLGDAVEVAQAIFSNVATGDCDDAQLSAWMNQSAKSSGFRMQLSAARLFGLIENTTGRRKLTQLGQMIVDTQRERDARVRAFMNVPLYSALYEKYKGGALPPAAAIEREIVGLGVVEKQKERARQVFERSADQAGFFESGRSRLVMPGIATRTEDLAPDPDKGGGGGGGGGVNLDLDPLLIELLKKIPGTEGGWSAEKRLRWFRTFAMNVSQIYDDDENPIELKIDLENKGYRTNAKDNKTRRACSKV